MDIDEHLSDLSMDEEVVCLVVIGQHRPSGEVEELKISLEDGGRP